MKEMNEQLKEALNELVDVITESLHMVVEKTEQLCKEFENE